MKIELDRRVLAKMQLDAIEMMSELRKRAKRGDCSEEYAWGKLREFIAKYSDYKYYREFEMLCGELAMLIDEL